MNTLKERINKDFVEALKNKRREEKTFLGVIKGELQNQEGRGVESTDENVLKVLKKTQKSLKETLSKGDESVKDELEILNRYLPELMSEDKVREIVSSLVSEGKTNIGLIMKEFNTTYRGQADNTLVKEIAESMI
jgi:uncharacterized protein YqeY